VRVANSKIKIVFVGIVDVNKNVLQKGIKIIRTGIYTFSKKELAESEDGIEGQKWLYSYFLGEMETSGEQGETVNIILNNRLKRNVRRYSIIDETVDSISVAIGNFKIIKPFHRDIQMELLKLNKTFIESHAPGKFAIFS